MGYSPMTVLRISATNTYDTKRKENESKRFVVPKISALQNRDAIFKSV